MRDVDRKNQQIDIKQKEVRVILISRAASSSANTSNPRWPISVRSLKKSASRQRSSTRISAHAFSCTSPRCSSRWRGFNVFLYHSYLFIWFRSCSESGVLGYLSAGVQPLSLVISFFSFIHGLWIPIAHRYPPVSSNSGRQCVCPFSSRPSHLRGVSLVCTVVCSGSQ